MTRPTALFLADVVEAHGDLRMHERKAVADELRRLHNERNELIQAMRRIESSTYDSMTAALIRVAIAKAENNT